MLDVHIRGNFILACKVMLRAHDTVKWLDPQSDVKGT